MNVKSSFVAGPYGADKAAFSLLTKLEKLKIKVPYERHFLLLCVCTSVFVKIRCYADLVFSKYESDWDKIRIFSTPKVLRFAEILEQFQPPDQNVNNTNKGTSESKLCNDKNCDTNENSQTNENNRTVDGNVVNFNENNQANHATGNRINENCNNDEIDTGTNENVSSTLESKEDTNTEDTKSKTNKMLEAIEKCDFISLSNRIEDRVHIIESNLKEINLNEECSENDNRNEMANKRIKNIIDNSQNKINEKTINDSENKVNDNENRINDKGLFPRRSGHRTRGRGRVQRSNAVRAQQLQQNPDALCGIVFMKEALMAKIMFMLIVVSTILSTYCVSQKVRSGFASSLF